MKTKKLALNIFLSFVLCSCCNVNAGRVLMDKIVARVNGTNILKSDLEQPRIEKNGQPYSLDELIDDELLFQKSAERKLLPTGLDVEKYITSWKTMNNYAQMTDDQFADRLKTEGLSLKRYKSQLARVLAVRNLKQLEVSERILISSREVEEYHKDNKEYADEKFLLQTAIVTFDEIEDEEKVEEEITKKKNIKWIDSDWIEKSDLADSMSFVHHMETGAVAKPIKMELGYQLVKLVDKKDRHIKTLEENYVEIERKLQDGKQEKFEEEFTQELRSKSSIVYLK
jgi:parvulin-like peptidyl-prolyl isomerase